jgi:hypothetical protein
VPFLEVVKTTKQRRIIVKELPESEIDKALNIIPDIIKDYIAEILKENKRLIHQNAKMKVQYESKNEQTLAECEARIENIKNPPPTFHLVVPAGKAAEAMPCEPPENVKNPPIG